MVQTSDDVAALAARPEACVQLEYVGIYSPEAFEVFVPGDFPNLKKVSLDNVDLGRNTLTKLCCLSKLDMLLISELQHDPVPTLNNLKQLPRLRHLVLNVGPGVTWVNFPEWKQLRTIQISSPDVSADELEQLRRRLPNCDLVVPDL